MQVITKPILPVLCQNMNMYHCFCFVCVFRTVTLTASDFDTSKTLLKRLRFCFPDNSIQLAPPDNLMQAYWQWLQSSYDPNRARKVYQTDHLGLQEDNYWLLDKEVSFLLECGKVKFLMLTFSVTDSPVLCTRVCC